MLLCAENCICVKAARVCARREMRSSCLVLSLHSRYPVLSRPTHLFLFPSPEYLRVRSHDPEEAIRHDVIVSIVTAAKKDLSLVNDALLNYVKERTLDKRVSHVF